MQELYDQYKGLLFKLAYQLTGSVSDAEDVVQDVFVKLCDVPPERLAQPKAYLCRMVTNRCRDLHKSARKKREVYFGEWLPEPLLDAGEDMAEGIARDDQLSYGILVLLERLTTTERTVFVLREALGFGYGEIAELLDKREANCRKLFSRACAKMGLDGEPGDRSEPAGEAWASGLLAALKQGNLERIMALLDQEVVLISDGGGKAQAAVNPIVARERVARFLLGVYRKTSAAAAGTGAEDDWWEIVRLNGQPALRMRAGPTVHTAALLQIERGLIHRLYFVRNPDKLRHVGR
ncbi:RNA polymerase sigma factor SigJ [Paenibacillus sp. IB182496]|uniref:RNA polymerase sigma factor SigJ n=1 Tax=Paenibacillus sabuli TaxID=2772509 RepID=A0A927BVE4_9BACL|nr:RNA polymerase sigma factor SigJ [Paenibacillus sabuli]MBD2846370.1 RNA polymerase sigma factor SigJ [Paenibacillus sabuli]